jgi:hypothetical protein
MSRSLPASLPCRFFPVLASLLLSGCGGYDGSQATTDTPVDTHLQVELVHSSSTPTLGEISPYEEALVVNEYRVSKVLDGPKPGASTIRIAQWAIANKKTLPLSSSPGNPSTLWITPFESMPELNSVYLRNDLDFDPKEKLFYDLSPLPDNYKPPKNVRYDYRSDLSRRMKVFWLIRHQLKLLVVGNSHTAAGVDPQLFYQPGNNDVPVSLSLSPAGSGADFQALLANEYAAVTPHLEWFVWGVSPRIFNSRYSIDYRANVFLKSPGYLYDRQHWQELVSQPAPDSPLNLIEIQQRLDSHDHPWGWAKKEEREFTVPISPAKRKEILHRCSRRRFDWNPEAWEQFQQAVETLANRGVRVLLFTPPFHPLVSETDNADGDGTGKKDYKKIVARLQDLADSHPGIYFLDINQGGHHEFKHEDFADIDHLFMPGAKILTEKLVKFVEKADSQP